MGNGNSTVRVRETRYFPTCDGVRIQIIGDNRAQLIFAPGATISPARTEFADEEDLLAYLKQFFPIVGEGKVARMTICRKGRYQRIDSMQRPILTFGDPVLDLITDPSGRVRIGATAHDFQSLLSAGRIFASGTDSKLAIDTLPINPAAPKKNAIDFTDGNFRMRFHAWRSNYLLFWKMGAEIETWGENFTWARIDSQYGGAVGTDGTVGGALCGVMKTGSDEAVDDDYIDEYEWGTAGSVQPASVRSMCSAVWRGELRQRLVEAGEACQAWIVDPPTTPPAPSVPPTITWTRNQPISKQRSKASPALASFNNSLHMVHLGDSSNDIWHSEFDGESWTGNQRVPNQQSKASPAIAAFGGKLHMVHLGNSSNDIWHSTYDGERWTENRKVPNQRSKSAPALAAFGGKLHMVHLGNSSNDIWHSTYDGERWTENRRIPNQRSRSTPALAASRGGLQMAHLGDSSNTIWHSLFDGADWSPNTPIPLQRSQASPALGALDARVYMVHLGDGSNDIWQSRTEGANWTLNTRIPNQKSKASPAIAEFRGSIYMVHLGDSSNDLWFSKTSG
jgi:hypothetical protein